MADFAPGVSELVADGAGDPADVDAALRSVQRRSPLRDLGRPDVDLRIDARNQLRGEDRNCRSGCRERAPGRDDVKTELPPPGRAGAAVGDWDDLRVMADGGRRRQFL